MTNDCFVRISSYESELGKQDGDMFAPHESPHDDQPLVRYLLGLLEEEDAERLDEMSVTDDDLAWQLLAVEDDLVDAYVRRTMADETREQFESAYLSSPSRLLKVRFAEGFLSAVDRGRPRTA
jgi:hypothetical protein